MDTPVRRLIKPTTPRTVHLLNLRGVLPHPVQGEATTESAFVQVAALCPATRRIASQPETLQLHRQTCTPDYRVETLDGQMSTWEVKLEAKLPKHRELFDAAARHLAERGEYFLVISEKSLRRRKQHEVVRLVLRYAKGHFDDAERTKVAGYLLAHPAGSSLAALMVELGVTRELVFHLIATRVITFAGTPSTEANARLVHTQHSENKNALQLARWLGVSPWRADV